MCVHVDICMCVQRPEKHVRSSGAEVICSCELSGMGSGNGTWVICKGTKHFEQLSHLSAPLKNFSIFFSSAGLQPRGYDKKMQARMSHGVASSLGFLNYKRTLMSSLPFVI